METGKLDIKLGHYRNRFAMFRTYYALANGIIQPDGLNLRVMELPDPPSSDLERSLVSGDIEVADLYLPNYIGQRLAGAQITAIATEWKTTLKGNGVFVRRDGPIAEPKDLEGRIVATHQGRHAIHAYLLEHRFGVDTGTINWVARPQEQLLSLLRERQADAAVLLDHHFAIAEAATDVNLLYTDGEAWQGLRGWDEMVKHLVVARNDVLADHPGIVETLLRAFRASSAYSGGNLATIADAFIGIYGGDKASLMMSATYPRFEFSSTDEERRIVEAEIAMLVEVGRLPEQAMSIGVFG